MQLKVGPSKIGCKATKFLWKAEKKHSGSPKRRPTAWGVCFPPPDLGKEICGGTLSAKAVFVGKERGLEKTQNESMLFKEAVGNNKCSLNIMNKKKKKTH